MRLTHVAIVAVAFVLPAGSIAALVACNAVLGIERATLDDGGGGGGDDGGGGGGGQDGSDPLTCANYCATIKQNCMGANQEYLSNDVCLRACSYMQAGQYFPASMEPGNIDSLGCRLWHAHSAAAHPETHCRHAGPLGADLCGGPCTPFCSLVWHFCTDDNGINVYDQQVKGCENVCQGDAGFSYLRGDSGDLVDPGGNMIEMGNTLNCRLWHIETAIAKSLPSPHCGHTGQVSATCQ